MKLSLVAIAAGAMLAGCAPSFYDAVPPGGPKDAYYADVGGTRIRFVDEGEGPPVVLLHGFASALDTWRGVMEQLKKSHRVIALDLKGFGWSSRPAGDYSPQAEAQLVLALMEQRNVKSAAVVAHSWGSSVALAMAIAAPERVTRLALYDAWVYEEQLPTTFLWARANIVGEALFDLFYAERPDEKMARAFYDPKRYVTEKFVEDVERALDRPGTTAAALAAVRGQRFEEIQSQYHDLKQPVLLLWGREDEVTLLAYGERLARDLPHTHLVVYPHCGHFPMIEAKGPSTDELEKFLGEGREKTPVKLDVATAGLAGAFVLLLATRARATGFTDIGEDIVPRTDTAVKLDGYLRVRALDLYNLDLDRGLTPSGQPLFPVPLGDPSGQSLTYADMRLRTDVAVYAPGGMVAVKARIDLLDNVAMGSNPQGIPNSSASQLSPSSAFRVKRAYGEALTPIGVIAAGRIGSSWGLGMLTNGGDCADCNYGDAADRVALITPLAGHIWALAYDIDQIGPFLAQPPGETALNLTPTANVNTITFAMLRYKDDLSRARRRAADKTTVEYGAYVSHRWQNDDVPGTYLPTAQPLAASSTSVMARGYQATAIDGWARVTHPWFRVEAEWAALWGSIDQASLIPGVLYRTAVKAQQMGAAIESEIGPEDSRFSAGLDAGYASGDQSPGFGANVAANSALAQPGDLNGAKANPPFHTTVNNFQFHPDYFVDRILFREIIGTVTGALYARPHARVDVMRVAPGVLQASVAGVASTAVFAENTPGGKAPLGIEIDPTLAYASRDGFGVALEYAVLFPLAGLDNPIAHLHAQPAQLGRVRLMYRF